ncbi:MAG: alanine--tRNA ligase [Holosporales bacterium]|nr:alanine--tRNA ligase [Holosporales bacterium]
MTTSVSEIRSAFLDFFIKHRHTNVQSSSLVPDNDPTLMFTNSGMVQFKDVFTGKKTMPFKRATTAQKSLRAGGKHNDLENVGYTARHHTFFEMLGNFSFGDYFKEDAINFAWDVVTQVLGISKEKLIVTVHSSDEDAASIWRKISGLEDSKIIRIPTNDNFWSMGDFGPCGPCSEIFYDHGPSIKGGLPGSESENEDGDRFIEIWNLVFMQFEKMENGSRVDLPRPSIDTGMGLERIAAVLQGVHNNYDIDLFREIITDIKNLTGSDNPSMQAHNNVIADHMRAISFMITDGIIPSNEGRGYVLRRIIRRALRHGYMMNLREPFLYKIVPSIKNTMGAYYKELAENESLIVQVLKNEEENFMKTIDNGMSMLQTEIGKIGASLTFPADVAFKLYDTYGFPFDLTQDILRGEGKKVNEEEFDKIARKQKETSKKAWVGTGDSFTDKIWFDISSDAGSSRFVRDTKSLDSEIVAIVKDSTNVQNAFKGDDAFIVSRETPFYAESGGQIGDCGFINSSKVVGTKAIEGLIVHECKVFEDFKVGDKATLKIDYKRRLSCSRNHTATHVLQAALKKILGPHVAQKGSLVTHERLRFDFIHNNTIQRSEIDAVEEIVRSAIDEAINVETAVMSVAEAKASGATALFGERYPDTVRVVSIGDDFSKELCGGTHVSNTSQIGVFKILAVLSIGSGVRRIEAATGMALVEFLNSSLAESSDKISLQTTLIRGLEKQIAEIEIGNCTADIKLESKIVDGVIFKYALVKDVDHKAILSIVDSYKNLDDVCLVIGNESSKSGKIAMSIFFSKELSQKQKAEELVAKLNGYLGEQKIKFNGKSGLIQFGGISIEQAKLLMTIVGS